MPSSVSPPAALLSRLDEDSAAVRRLRYLRSDTIFAGGERADRLFFLRSGLVKILKRNLDGREILVSLVRPGELFGELSMLPDFTHGCFAEALEESVVEAFSSESFRQFCQAQPELWRWLVELLAGQVEKLRQTAALLALHTVEQRILYSLVELSDFYGGTQPRQGVVSIPISQYELAGMVGATRETTSSALNQLARRGLVRLGRRRVMIPSPEALRLAAGESGASAAAGQGSR